MNRKLLCFALALILCLSLMACGSRQNPSAAAEATAPAETVSAQDDAAAVEADTAKAEQEKTDAPASESQKETETAPAFQPGVDTTLPPEVDASLGVEKDDTPEIPDDDASEQQPSGNAPAAQPDNTPSQIGPDFDLRSLTYEGYQALSGADQQKVIDMFGSSDDFMVWYGAVEAQYKAQHPDIEIGADGVVDAGNLGG